VLVAVAIAVGTPFAMITTSVTAECGAVLILGKMGRRQHRRHGKQRGVNNYELKGGLV
jgi:hypothetical protein